jgi:hypothetical protein
VASGGNRCPTEPCARAQQPPADVVHGVGDLAGKRGVAGTRQEGPTWLADRSATGTICVDVIDDFVDERQRLGSEHAAGVLVRGVLVRGAGRSGFAGRRGGSTEACANAPGEGAEVLAKAPVARTRRQNSSGVIPMSSFGPSVPSRTSRGTSRTEYPLVLGHPCDWAEGSIRLSETEGLRWLEPER